MRDKSPGSGIDNVHMGFDPANADALAAFARKRTVCMSMPKKCSRWTVSANCVVNWMRNQLVSSTAAFVASSHLLKSALNPVLTLASVWKHTPPGLRRIRKYGDMINHRLLKAVIKGETATRPQEPESWCKWPEGLAVSTGWQNVMLVTGYTDAS